MMLIRHNLEDEENPTLFEELLGDKGMGVVKNGSGKGFAAAGTIACFYFLSKSGAIRSVHKGNFQSFGSVKLTPAIVLERHTKSTYPGLTLSILSEIAQGYEQK